MAIRKHSSKPLLTTREGGYIGELPSSSGVGYNLVRQVQYLLNYLQQQQWYSYSGPGYSVEDTSSQLPNPHHDWISTDVIYYVIMHAPPKADTSNPTRQLGGALLPWSYAGSVANKAEVLWTPPGESQVTLWESTGDFPVDSTSASTTPLKTGDHLKLWNRGSDRFEFEPQSIGEWNVGELETKYIRTAALGIWPMPDPTVTAAQQQIAVGNVSPDKIIRALDSSEVESLGHLIYMLGGDTLTVDNVESMTKRCLLQSGHPQSLVSDTASYVNIRGSGYSTSTFQVRSRNLLGASSGTVESFPAVVAQTSGASQGDPGYVKFTSSTGSDTWILDITQDEASPTLYQYDDRGGGADTLAIDNDSIEEITIEIQAPTSGYIRLFTYSLWEDNELIF